MDDTARPAGPKPEGPKRGEILGKVRRATPPARGMGERCKLPQWGPGQSPGRNRCWCISKACRRHFVVSDRAEYCHLYFSISMLMSYLVCYGQPMLDVT